LIIDFLGPICEIPQEMIGDPKGIFTNKENFCGTPRAFQGT
jgi:hypothetical protein